MRRTAVLNVVGLTPRLLGPQAPFLTAWIASGAMASLRPTLPAVTCGVQASMLTGAEPARHGIVGNGWYDRESCEIRFWRQSNRLVQAPKVWEAARRRDPAFTCANLFWWFAMYAETDVAVTPRPMYPADGRKIPDIWTDPPELRGALQERLGRFPLFEFWGPRTSIRSSRWIAEAAKLVEAARAPTLTLVYLPHLDYALQRLGPHDPGIGPDLGEIDAVCADLVRHYEERGVQVILLSEYGITPVSRPVALNRVLRERGLVTVREELGRELLDAGASAAFAVADHQVAHVYVRDPARLGEVRALLEGVPGVAALLDDAGKLAHGLHHPRAGDLVALAEPDAWFTYYYWLDDRRAPDFARTVDIHRKPGYDPVELFLDPAIRLPGLKVAGVLARRALGFRALMDVTPLDPALVRGSHGLPPAGPADAPLLATRARHLLPEGEIAATEVHDLILAHLFGAEEADQVTAKARARTSETGSSASTAIP
ncbi:nucleotide pyrophosphatase/phosphodiesterase family protein [Crenalkalicoccus roseus]|uniref:nucleotide pyrophosphatase/phosphodiesterase family protein n=1 Tax=Crenalkalicoccus roseus TaxID=1485588 RepID=UPI001080221B|nr:nucleotide pyrophosphatase/phosphodiesterase family protein [Crenalkalicoccus roseus]